MLPFLMARKQASVVGTAKNGSVEIKKEEGGVDPAMLSAAEDLISAVHMKDANAVAMALEAACQIVDSMPQDDEGEAK